MPFNSLVNMAYVFLGVYWLRSQARAPGGPAEKWRARYLKDCLAEAWPWLHGSGPVAAHWDADTAQRCAGPVAHFTHLRVAGGLVPLPGRGWKPRLLLAVEGLSLCSYSLALLHPPWLELARPAHCSCRWARPCAPRYHGNSSSECTWLWACSPAWALWSSSYVTMSSHSGISSSSSQGTSGPKSVTASVPLCLPVPDQLTYLPLRCPPAEKMRLCVGRRGL